MNNFFDFLKFLLALFIYGCGGTVVVVFAVPILVIEYVADKFKAFVIELTPVLQARFSYQFGTARAWIFSIFAVLVMAVVLAFAGFPVWMIFAYSGAFLVLLFGGGLLGGVIGFTADLSLVIIAYRRAGR